MYEILVYVFEHCQHSEVARDRAGVAQKLSAAGFERADISTALNWLAGALRTPAGTLAPLPDARRSFRAYAARELAKLDTECRGFLATLERAGILSPQLREHVLERALAAPGELLTLEQLKLIVVLVLWNLEAPASRLLAADLFTQGASLPS